MNFSAWAIRRPLPALMIFFVLCVAGLWGFRQLPIARFPDVAFPMVTVGVSLPGASPSQLETEVTRKIEDRVAAIGAVSHISAIISDGLSLTTVELDVEVDPQLAISEVRDAVASVRTQLPLIMAHVVCSVFAGIAGLLLASRLGVGSPTVGTQGGYDLLSIAAVVLGGTLLAGGRGTIWGTIGGVAIFAVLDNLMSVLQVNPFVKDVVRGIVIVAAVAIYSRRRVIARRIRFSTNTSSGEASPPAAVLESDAHEGSAR